MKARPAGQGELLVTNRIFGLIEPGIGGNEEELSLLLMIKTPNNASEASGQP